MPKGTIKFTEPHLLSKMPKDTPILVALSGGADSSALLHLLASYRERNNCPVIAAHVNHGIRGEKYCFEADRDEKFCRSLCESLGIELHIRKLDIPMLAALSGRSVETEAREARYSFFADLMKEKNIRILATAHNADDNIETQLFNLCRGCGIDGLVGIPEVREFESVCGGIVIRPLLKADKCNIVAYCEENNIAFVTDSTNLEDDCTRNEIRHKIIPEIVNIFPTAKKNALKLSESAAEDSDFILGEAKKFLTYKARIEVGELRALHPSLCKRVLMLAYAECSDATLESVHLDSLISLLSNEKNGAGISLPNKKHARVIDGMLIFANEQKNCEKEQIVYSQKLYFGTNIIENTDFAVLIEENDAKNTHFPIGYAPYASAEIKTLCKDSLYARSRTPGACVTDGGVNKRIKKLMCDKKIPLLDRDTLPLIYSDESVIYVPLCAVSDCAKVKKHEGTIKIHILKKISEA